MYLTLDSTTLNGHVLETTGSSTTFNAETQVSFYPRQNARDLLKPIGKIGNSCVMCGVPIGFSKTDDGDVYPLGAHQTHTSNAYVQVLHHVFTELERCPFDSWDFFGPFTGSVRFDSGEIVFGSGLDHEERFSIIKAKPKHDSPYHVKREFMEQSLTYDGTAVGLTHKSDWLELWVSPEHTKMVVAHFPQASRFYNELPSAYANWELLGSFRGVETFQIMDVAKFDEHYPDGFGVPVRTRVEPGTWKIKVHTLTSEFVHNRSLTSPAIYAELTLDRPLAQRVDLEAVEYAEKSRLDHFGTVDKTVQDESGSGILSFLRTKSVRKEVEERSNFGRKLYRALEKFIMPSDKADKVYRDVSYNASQLVVHEMVEGRVQSIQIVTAEDLAEWQIHSFCTKAGEAAGLPSGSTFVVDSYKNRALKIVAIDRDTVGYLQMLVESVSKEILGGSSTKLVNPEKQPDGTFTVDSIEFQPNSSNQSHDVLHYFAAEVSKIVKPKGYTKWKAVNDGSKVTLTPATHSATGDEQKVANIFLTLIRFSQNANHLVRPEQVETGSEGGRLIEAVITLDIDQKFDQLDGRLLLQGMRHKYPVTGEEGWTVTTDGQTVHLKVK